VKLCSYRYPTPGDVLEIEITGIGVLRNKVVAGAP
jgi:2-keto-4-pentenoate hydratase/2-oxohepta-3-ene-1,7-dioic acid hydratase in catechol pathway